MKFRFQFVVFFIPFIFAFLPFLSAQEKKDPLSFTTHTQKIESLTFHWEPLPIIDDFDIHQAHWSIINQSDQEITCDLRFSSIDTITLINDSQKTDRIEEKRTIPGGQKIEGDLKFQLLPGTFTAHYPLRMSFVFNGPDGKPRKGNIVRVMETNVPLPSSSVEQKTIIKNGGVSLLSKPFTASWFYDKGEKKELGANWFGNSEECKTSLNRHNVDCGGEMRQAFTAHPPYSPKGGSLWLDFPVVLPSKKKIEMNFGCAIRKTFPGEPNSDGVTFRIWGNTQGSPQKILHEIHTISKNWVDQKVDLSEFAGQSVLLSVEFNPGPKNNTVCDGCYLSDLIITTSDPDIQAEKKLEKKEFSFDLVNGMKAIVHSGEKGLFDASLTIQDTVQNRSLHYQGFSLALDGKSIFSLLNRSLEKIEQQWDPSEQKLTTSAKIVYEDQIHHLSISAYVKNGLLIIEIPESNPDRIGPFSLNGSDQAIHRVYFGHGYIIEQPKDSFSIHAGGHNLSTSHVGFDYANGLSVLHCSSIAPRSLKVDPDKKIGTLETVGSIRYALLPGRSGALNAAIQFRSLSPWYRAPGKGVARKAGRFVYDVWGGSYSSNKDAMEKAFQYGIQDAIFIKHCWQRWGYDVRLPDIFGDPDDPILVLPELGTLQDLRDLVQCCTSRKIPFALHDNYIDFYPDANDFSYKSITFNEKGQPKKAWINHGKGVQSYQWRPDLFQPFLDKNLDRCKDLLPEVDSLFVDVFSSMAPFPYLDREGNFHPLSETIRYWSDAFKSIDKALTKNGESGISISEAGSDFLIGGLDSADVQWMQISSKGKTWAMRILCEKWARTPWFAAVNHTNFSRHGAGYPDRYAGIRNSVLHGPMSDDYICSEILGGLDLMVSLGNIFPDSVRKYNLAQHVARQLADKEIVSIQFDRQNGIENIQRQIVQWSDGTKVCANRGIEDWTIDQNIVLPLYGYCVFDSKGKILSAIYRNPKMPKEIIEVSERSDSFYMNGRGNRQQEILAITPSLDSFKIVDSNKIRITIDWQVDEIPQKDLLYFVHFFESYRGYGHKAKGWYSGSGKFDPQKSDLHGHYKTASEMIHTIPDHIPNGTYHIMVGLYDPVNGRRYPLMGEDAREIRYSIAEFKIQRNGKNSSLSITPLPLSEHRDLFMRLLGNTKPLEWKGISTLGAISVIPEKDRWTILPIPTLDQFEIALDQEKIGRSIQSITCEGKDIPMIQNGKIVRFNVEAKNAVPYCVRFK